MSNLRKYSAPVLISFSGIDGAGKSTQIVNLQSLLEKADLRVGIITFWDDVVRLKKWREHAGQKIFNGDAGVGTPEEPIERRDKNVRSPFMTLVRFALYTLDAFSLRRIAARTTRSSYDVVIFDRYIYDEWANLDLKNPFARLYLSWMSRLVPSPARAFILDAEPRLARARKPEYPLSFLHENRAAYLALNGRLGSMTIIPAGSIDEAKREIARSVAPIFASISLTTNI
jgi:thymidylate kinase